VATVVVKLVVDYRLWKQEKPVNHPKEWALIALGNCPSIAMLSVSSHAAWWVSLALSSMVVSSFIWLFFDGIYNRLRGYGWWFTGSDDADDALLDNVLQSLELWQHVSIKIGGFLLTLILYTLTA
jgi:hypothetical protein